jgi:peptidoglycan/xylan/chitin deacetylase (PgdA/CDA1 family)
VCGTHLRNEIMRSPEDEIDVVTLASRIFSLYGEPENPDVIGLLCDAITGEAERAMSLRDEFDNAEAITRQYVAIPPVGLSPELRTSVHPSRALCGDAGSFALCVTHDVDLIPQRHPAIEACRRAARYLTASKTSRVGTYQALRSLAVAVAREIGIGRMTPFDHWIRQADRFQYRPTWFFLAGDYRPRDPLDMNYLLTDEMVGESSRGTVADFAQEVHSRGHEVGLHGSIAAATDGAELLRQRRLLEGATGIGLQSVRMHYLRFDWDKTPTAIQHAGFRFDSTLGFNRRAGYRTGATMPHPLWCSRTGAFTDVLEVPMAIMDVQFPIGAPRDVVSRIQRDTLDWAARTGGCCVLNWHPNYISQQLYIEQFEALLQRAKALGAWGCTVSEVGEAAAARLS